MSIVQDVIQRISVMVCNAALAPVLARVAALEARPAMSEADRATLDKAAALVAEFEAAGAGDLTPVEVETAEDGSITLPEIR
jgi:hypothetical protein